MVDIIEFVFTIANDVCVDGLVFMADNPVFFNAVLFVNFFFDGHITATGAKGENFHDEVWCTFDMVLFDFVRFADNQKVRNELIFSSNM